MDKNILNDLIDKVNQGTASDDDLKAYNAYLNQVIDSNGSVDNLQPDEEQELKIELMHRITAQIKEESHPQHKSISWPRIAAAASILIILSVGCYLILRPHAAEHQVVQVQQDLKPGINGAILTLANGQKIILEQTKVGTISAGIQKSNDSLLTYNGSEPIGYNMLETPRGRQYSVVLPDGSKVWLNAASSLKYPTRFAKERLVELTGEAYFEVVHNSKMPFRVKTNNQITEDIGTSFNINAYSDENVAVTTLVEGAIKVNQTLLKPGQAAILKTLGKVVVSEVNTDEAIAWKNGKFNFKDADIQTVMRQFARWYDVDVEYDGEKPNTSINGEVYRNVNASQALKILTYLNIHFRIENKKIIIIK